MSRSNTRFAPTLAAALLVSSLGGATATAGRSTAKPTYRPPAGTRPEVLRQLPGGIASRKLLRARSHTALRMPGKTLLYVLAQDEKIVIGGVDMAARNARTIGGVRQLDLGNGSYASHDGRSWRTFRVEQGHAPRAGRLPRPERFGVSMLMFGKRPRDVLSAELDREVAGLFEDLRTRGPLVSQSLGFEATGNPITLINELEAERAKSPMRRRVKRDGNTLVAEYLWRGKITGRVAITTARGETSLEVRGQDPHQTIERIRWTRSRSQQRIALETLSNGVPTRQRFEVARNGVTTGAVKYGNAPEEAYVVDASALPIPVDDAR